MAGYCTSVQPYFHEPQASENTAQECNYTTLIQQYLEDRQLLRMHSTKVIAVYSCYAAYALRAIRYGPSDMGKYQSCCSTGNTIGAYTRYIIKINNTQARGSIGHPDIRQGYGYMFGFYVSEH